MSHLLHVKSEFSFGCGTALVEELVRHAANFGSSTLALTDVENLAAKVRFHRAAVAHGVKPITGIELRAGYAQHSGGNRGNRLVLRGQESRRVPVPLPDGWEEWSEWSEWSVGQRKTDRHWLPARVPGHRADSLCGLLDHLETRVDDPSLVVWAHNSHGGDARATEMESSGEVNLSQLVRARHGSEALIIGLSSYQGP